MSIEQEPVAWMWEEEFCDEWTTVSSIIKPKSDKQRKNIQPLYIEPPKSEPKEIQPEQEPVAWHYIYDDGITVRERVTEYMPLGKHYAVTPLYTAPPKREPLSDEEIADLWGDKYAGKTFMVRNFARAIEKAHGITGGGE